MVDMAIFSKYNGKIDASKRRVTAMWFGDVDCIELLDGSTFTGTAVMTTIYTLSGFYQYYVIFYSLSNRIVEIWKVSAENIPITSASECEFGVIRVLQNKNIELTQVPADSPHFNKLLMRLPLSFDDDNSTQPNANLYAAPGAQKMGISLSKEEIGLIRRLILCQ